MKKVLITGASRGFGLELLKTYLKNDWMVFPLIRDPDSIKEIQAIYEDHCFPITGDVTDDHIIDRIQNTLKDKTDALDLLINNAGNIRKVYGISNATANDLLDHFDVHCAGAFRCVKATLPFLQNASSPVVLNITSRRGSKTLTSTGKYKILYGYQIAKAAQNMLTVCLQQELKQHNIRAFSVHPGKLKTSVAPPDADTLPETAAQKLFEWAQNLDANLNNKCYDLMENSTIEW